MALALFRPGLQRYVGCCNRESGPEHGRQRWPLRGRMSSKRLVSRDTRREFSESAIRYASRMSYRTRLQSEQCTRLRAQNEQIAVTEIQPVILIEPVILRPCFGRRTSR